MKLPFLKQKNETELKIEKSKQKKQKIENSLNWTDLIEVRANGLLLKKGKRTEIVKGIKVSPHNLFLMDALVQQQRVVGYRNALNNLGFQIYHAMIYNPIDIRKNYERLEMMLENENISSQRKVLIKESLYKLDYFTNNYKELEFFLMIKGNDDKKLAKQFYDLKRFMKHAQFIVHELEVKDYENYLANIFENELINDFYFAKGEFEILNEQYHLDQMIESQILLFDSPSIYQIMDKNYKIVFEFEPGDPKHSILEANLNKNEYYYLVSCDPKSIYSKELHYQFLIDNNNEIVILPNQK